MAYTYSKLGIEEFGDFLLSSNDLDPVYVALVKANLDPVRLRRWLVAYWCFYHCGVASYLSDHDGVRFVDQLLTAAENKEPAPTGGRWPRGSERRHFRGEASRKAVTRLYERYGSKPEDMVDACAQPTCKKVIAAVKEHYLFGDWIGFKIADMLERVMAIEVCFDRASVFFFKDPREAAARFWAHEHGLNPKVTRLNEPGLNAVVTQLEGVFGHYSAPPRYDRPVGLQEIETILCKWKSHLNGHYPLYKDTKEIREGLAEWSPFSATARRVLAGMPEVIGG